MDPMGQVCLFHLILPSDPIDRRQKPTNRGTRSSRENSPASHAMPPVELFQNRCPLKVSARNITVFFVCGGKVKTCLLNAGSGNPIPQWFQQKHQAVVDSPHLMCHIGVMLSLHSFRKLMSFKYPWPYNRKA